jgi:type II secretion system protein H
MVKMQKILSHHNDSGFSLLEVMIVMAILTVMAAIAIPNMFGRRGDASLKSAVNILKGDLNLAKSMAARDNSVVTVSLWQDHYRVVVNKSSRLMVDRKMPPGVWIDLAASTLDAVCTGADEDCTSFNPRGLPTVTGTIVMVEKSGDQRQIQMNRLGRLVVQ